MRRIRAGDKPSTRVPALVTKVTSCASYINTSEYGACLLTAAEKRRTRATAMTSAATMTYTDIRMLSSLPTALSRSRIEFSMDSCSRWKSLRRWGGQHTRDGPGGATRHTGRPSRSPRARHPRWHPCRTAQTRHPRPPSSGKTARCPPQGDTPRYFERTSKTSGARAVKPSK